jgi:hypothetical protein
MKKSPAQKLQKGLSTLEKLQIQKDRSHTGGLDGDAQNNEDILEGPITKENYVRNKLVHLGIPYTEEFLTGSRYDELQKGYKAFELNQRHHMNKTLNMNNETLETVNIEILKYIHHTLLSNSSLRSKVKMRILLAELQGIPKGDPATPAVIKQTQLELDYIRFAVSAEDLTNEERIVVTGMAMKIRKERIAKYGNPYKKGLKSNQATTPGPVPPTDDKTPTISKVVPNLMAHKMFNPSADTVITPNNPWEKIAGRPVQAVTSDKAKTADDAENNSSLIPLLGSSRKHPVHVTEHNRKAQQKKARKMRQKAQTSSTSTDAFPEPPANAASISQLCPHPHKKNYVTTELAEAFIREAHSDDPDIEAYRCRCGGIHLGHPSINNSSERMRRKRQQEMESKSTPTLSSVVSKTTPHDVFRAAQRQKNQEKKDA